MEKINLVTFLKKPIRAFRKKEDAERWIKNTCKYFEMNINDYSIEKILMY